MTIAFWVAADYHYTYSIYIYIYYAQLYSYIILYVHKYYKYEVMQLESSASLSMTQAVQPGRVEEWDPAAGQSCIVGIASAKSRKNSW